MIYIDEFSGPHDKDASVREALAGQVPSTGIDTYSSRCVVTVLLVDGGGTVFDV